MRARKATLPALRSRSIAPSCSDVGVAPLAPFTAPFASAAISGAAG